MKLLSDLELARLVEEAAAPDLSQTRYSIVRPVASGGMGRVYLVKDTELGRDVALKVMNLPDVSEELAARMLREARIIAGLEHPGIVPVHDLGRLPDGRIFFTMKYVQGRTLDAYVKDELLLPELVRCFLRISEAVAFAHSRGVIHRDLKPENIMIGPFGEVLVMDWGIAKLIQEDGPVQIPSKAAPGSDGIANASQSSLDPGAPGLGPSRKLLTGAGAVLGTPQFMSPEQAEGRTQQIGPSSDVYGLGAVLFYMLTGMAPLPLAGGGPDWPAHSRSIPKSLKAICAKCLSLRSADRYRNAGELSDDVIRFLDDKAVSAHPETLADRLVRVISKNRFLVFLIAAYLIMRALVLFFAHR